MPLGHMASFDRQIFLDLLEKSGLSQQALAVKLGVSRGIVGHWAQGRSKPSPPNVPALAKALGVEPFELTGRTPEQADIADLRVCLGLHGTEAAAAAGLSPSAVSTLEAAVNMPNVRHLDALAGVYHVSTERIRQAWMTRRVNLYGPDSLDTLDDKTRRALGLWKNPG
jgi:transcriptional regulator with XRE-family HTH domain